MSTATSQTMENQIALVTGASRGIGKAIARALGQRGATVVGTATTTEGAAAITDYLQSSSLRGGGIELNVTDADSIQNAFKQMHEQYGEPAILVNNAGITRDNLLMRMKDDEWQSILDTNLSSVYRISKLCVKTMMKARYGRIVTISSVVGVAGNAGQTNYAAAKAGVIGFSKSLAREVGVRGITVNTVAPGFIDTDMTRKLSDDQRDQLLSSIPMNRLGQVEEVAAAVCFLASPEAGYITGETLNINGGMYMA